MTLTLTFMQVKGELEEAEWEQKTAAEAEKFDWRHFADESLVRRFHAVTDIGTSAMTNRTKLQQVCHPVKLCSSYRYCTYPTL
jgi:hypothetical protein